MITQLIEFDVKKNSHITITAKEGDINSRKLEFRLLDNSLPFSLVGRTVRCYMVKPDKRVVFNDLDIIDAEDGRCVLTLTTQSLIKSGMANIELIIYEEGKKLSSIPIKMNIMKSLVSDELLYSSDEFGALESALWKIDTFTETMNSKATKEELKKVNEQLDNKVNKSEIGSPIAVNSVVEMTDITRVYVNRTDGNWYSYNGVEWTIGGVYNSQALGYKSVTLSHLDDVCGKYNGYKLNSKQQSGTNYSYFACMFSTEGLGITSGEYKVNYEYFCNDENLIKLETQLMINDSPDINIITGTNYMLNSNYKPIFNIRDKVEFTGGSYVNNTYVKLYITLYSNAYVGDISCYFRNLQVSVNGINLKYVSVAPYPPANGSTIDEIEYLGDELVSRKEFLQVKDTKSSKWKGKKVNFLGDSITEGVYIPTVTKTYPMFLQEKLGLAQARNYGEGGTMISDGDRAFYKRYNEMDNDADLIVVFGGTNDYSMSTKPFGEIGSYSENDFCGCVRNLLDGLIEKYMGKKIVVLLPIHRINDYLPNPTTQLTLHEYRNAIKEIANYLGIAVIDVGSESGLHGHNDAFCKRYIPDYLHPNQDGMEILADFLADRLEYI